MEIHGLFSKLLASLPIPYNPLSLVFDDHKYIFENIVLVSPVSLSDCYLFRNIIIGINKISQMFYPDVQDSTSQGYISHFGPD